MDELRSFWRENGIRSLYFFATAILAWNKVRKEPHLAMCNFIQDIEAPRKRRKCLLVPRDTYKSTIGSKSFPLWILVQPEFCGLPGREHRILLWSHASENAKKQIRSIKQQVERNQILAWLYPEIIPNVTQTTWSDSNLLFPRNGAYGEDTIEAAGLDTHLVSRHYTIQIKDDIEDKASYEQPSVRQKVKDTYKTAEALFVDEQQAYDLLIGTRWGVDDLYSEIQANESEFYEFYVRPLHWTQEELQKDLDEAKELGKPPVWNMKPQEHAPDPDKTYYFFPELFPEVSCRRIRAKQGSFFYAMLYLNNPKDTSLTEFKSEDFGRCAFDDEGNIVLYHVDGSREIVPVDACKRVLFWDPAMSAREKKRNSRNAMVVAYRDPRARIFFMEGWAEFRDPTLLFSKFIGFHQRHNIHTAAIEDVGFQRTLKFPMFQEMKRIGHVFHVREERPIQAKEVRIRSLLPFVEAHDVFIRQGLSDLKEEFTGFPLFKTMDLADAAAACLSLFGLQGVQSHGQTQRADARELERTATRSKVTGY